MAILALLAMAGGIASDYTNGTFWSRHSVLASLVASLIVVMLSVAVVNEAIERRRRQRWSILAQFIMFELVRNARMIWSGVLEVSGLLPPPERQRDPVATGAEIVRDTSRLTAAITDVLGDDDRRQRLHDEVAFLAEHSDEVLGRWASVMLNAAVYAEIIDRHVELAGDIAWIGSILDSSRPPSDPRRQKRARSNPAVQIHADDDDNWLAARMVVVTQLAERLDQGTLEIALRIVPVQWWQDRLSGSASGPDGGDPAPRRWRRPA